MNINLKSWNYTYPYTLHKENQVDHKYRLLHPNGWNYILHFNCIVYSLLNYF